MKGTLFGVILVSFAIGCSLAFHATRIAASRKYAIESVSFSGLQDDSMTDN